MQGSFDGETFTFSLFLVLCNRLTTMAVALSMLLVRMAAGAGRGCFKRLTPRVVLVGSRAGSWGSLVSAV